MNHRFVFVAVITLLLITGLTVKPTPPTAQARAVGADPPVPKGKLAVLIVIDQLRGDYLTRFGDLFGEGGFRLFTERGAWFTNCHYENGVTKTAPGHASIATGANPAVHGIVGNDWYERVEGQLKAALAVGDSNSKTVGLPAGVSFAGASPHRLLVDALADRLKAASPKSRVLSCSLKDTAANLAAGKSADGVYWWHTASGAMVTSEFFAKKLPGWAQSFNEQRSVDRFFGQRWVRLADPAEYDRRCRRDDFSYEWGHYYTESNDFPHTFGKSGAEKVDSAYYRAVLASPFGNEVLLDFTRRGIEAMELGKRGVTDLLLLSLSSNDLVGHAYGPLSHEVMDVTLRTDRQLAKFFKYLDERVGLDNCVVVLTGDHGAGMVPEYAEEKKLGGGRLNTTMVAGAINDALVAAMGTPAGGVSYVAGIAMPWVYLDHAMLKNQNVSTDKLRTILNKLAKDQAGYDAFFVADDIRRDDFITSPVSHNPANGASGPSRTADTAVAHLRVRVKNCYFAGRSGDVYVHVAENWYAGGHAAGHGSAHAYNTHVPLLLFGQGIKPGKHNTPAAPTDIAPTLARLLGIPKPTKSTGRVLHEVMAK
ncbi:MAG: alkaline phosphatase family protein [Planctomycetes bacterium]|nr:alkaline phosphatase family protein [Planctomycetota bacterium]